MASDVHTKFGSTHECGGLHFFFVDLQVFPQAVLVHSLFHPTPFSKRQALNHICTQAFHRVRARFTYFYFSVCRLFS